MTGRHPSLVVEVVSVLMAPFIMLFGLYVIAHGHYGPGGGFAGGVVLGVGVIILRLTADPERAWRAFPASLGLLAGGIGMALFVAVALAPMAAGGAFLDYAALAVGGMAEAQARYLGILVVEIAVGLAVFGAMVLIFDVLSGTGEAADTPAASAETGAGAREAAPADRPGTGAPAGRRR